ncbi:MAG: ATP-binding protein [Bacteroidetes bacterium]|nr:ATP-binding protein [Bacteroidota bacterium]
MIAYIKDSNRPRDRGPSPFFHGREEIIDNFNIVLDDYKALKDGTTFMIQGSPGVGKTALIDVLAREASNQGWKSVHIGTNTLWKPDDLLHRLGKKTNMRITGASVEASIDQYVKASAGLSVDIFPVAQTIIKILQDDKKPLLLILDEAQALGLPGVVPAEMKGDVTDVLKQIHNGEMGRPVMLLTGGLGTTESALSTFGISRFEGDCKVYLGRLDKASERAVVHDWLMHAGLTARDTSAWIDAITEHTYGWPQHIMSYVKPAVKYLKANKHQMTDEGVDFVLVNGKEARLEYYDSRAHDIDEHKREALARAVMDVPTDSTTTRPAISSSLKKSGLTEKEADSLFTRALDQGIIDKRKGGRYGIPIPSMHSWLIDEHLRNKS